MKPDVVAARNSLEADPDNAALNLALAKTLIDAAWFDGSDWQRYYSEATSIYESLLSDDPTNAIVLVNLGAAVSDQGLHQRALDYYREAERLGWLDGNLEHNIGVAMINLGDHDNGARRLQRSSIKSDHSDTIKAYFDPQVH